MAKKKQEENIDEEIKETEQEIEETEESLEKTIQEESDFDSYPEFSARFNAPVLEASGETQEVARLEETAREAPSQAQESSIYEARNAYSENEETGYQKVNRSYEAKQITMERPGLVLDNSRTQAAFKDWNEGGARVDRGTSQEIIQAERITRENTLPFETKYKRKEIR